MDLAQKIQTVLLPTDARIPGYEIALTMRAAANVGGDYYDVFRAGGLDWLLVGDVSGHGVRAGLCMMMVSTAVRSVVRTLERRPGALRPSDVLALVNAAVHRNLSQIGRNLYMTINAFCFQDGAIRYAGQHQDILVWRAATGEVERRETSGVWLGVLDDIDGMLDEDRLELAPGDVMLLFTDGLTEAKLDQTRMLGTDGLAVLFQGVAAAHPSPPDIIEQVIGQLKNCTITDDVTLIAVKRIAQAEDRRDA
jgi:serine phosphatase RsbU (regulator of sigma subunit)